MRQLFRSAVVLWCAGCAPGLGTEPTERFTSSTAGPPPGVECAIRWSDGMVDDLELVLQPDYIALIDDDDSSIEPPRVQRGERCKGARDKLACLGKLRDGLTPRPAGFGGESSYHLVVTVGDDVLVLSDPDHVRELLGPIDTRTEAVLVAVTQGWKPDHKVCELARGIDITEDASGFTFDATRKIEKCPTTYDVATVTVARDGSLHVVSKNGTRESEHCDR